MSKVVSRRRRFLPATSLLCLALILGGCSGDDDKAEDVKTTAAGSDDSDKKDSDKKDDKGSSADVCKLITDAEAETALGGPTVAVDDAVSTVGASSTCNWQLASDELTGFFVTVLEGQGQVDLFEQKMSGDSPIGSYEQKIEGLGEGAGCTPGPLDTAVLEVLTDQESVLQLAGSTCEQLETLARAAYDRL